MVGGMVETGFWQALDERYQAARGNKIEVVASGPKPVVIEAFRKGGIDLITVHACDAMASSSRALRTGAGGVSVVG